jgi:phage terminase large subunit-like protein
VVDAWDQYIDDVLNDRIVAGKWIKLACQRHLNDLDNGQERGLRFDAGAARRVLAFFSMLNHSKGEWAGTLLELEPWQAFHLAYLFGWKRADGSRRFRTSFLTVARKNGKSLMSSGVGLYMMLADGEQGAEVYSAASKKDQARITFEEARRMVLQSPALKKLATVQMHNIHSAATFSKFEPLGGDSDSLDGLNIQLAIADEVHVWKDRHMWDVLQTATGARRQPLMYAITTAGYDRQSLCYQLHIYTEKVLSGVIEDDSFAGWIYTIDDEDDWEDEAVWAKANPNLGVSVKVDNLREKAAQAKAMPAALNAFLRLHQNVWTQSETRWINREKWDAGDKGVIDEDALAGRRCYAGLDLSSNTDLTACVLVFPPLNEGDDYIVLPRVWIPEDKLWERSKRDRVPYDAWLRAGLLQATPGNVIDYDFVRAQLVKDAQKFDLHELAYDRWGSTQIITNLQEDGFRVDEKAGGGPLIIMFGQGYASMNGPLKELEKLILAGRLSHGGHKVLTWCADNAVVKLDPAGNMKLDKSTSVEKIDVLVALVMGLARAIAHGEPGKSVYEGRGIRVL